MRIIFTSMVLVFMFKGLQGQTKAITQDGKTVTLYSNGTYEYTDGSKQSAVSKDCATYNVGDLKIINKSNISYKGSVYFKQWSESKGKGSILNNARDFILKPGESISVGDVYAGNVTYAATKQIPNPYSVGEFIWENFKSVESNGYVKTCEVIEFVIQ
jgi:hypothetical protein